MCVPCGFTQVVASLAMTGMGVMAGVGGFLAMILILKFKSDLKFKITLKLVFKVRIARPAAAEIALHKAAIKKCCTCCCPKRFFIIKTRQETVYVRVVNHVHTKKVHAQDKPPNQHEFQGSLGGMYLLRMYMIYYS